jgi:hypothetical protein
MFGKIRRICQTWANPLAARDFDFAIAWQNHFLFAKHRQNAKNARRVRDMASGQVARASGARQGTAKGVEMLSFPSSSFNKRLPFP